MGRRQLRSRCRRAACLPAWHALLPVAGGFVRVALLQPSDGCQRVPGAVGGFSWCPPAELAELPPDRGCWGLESLPWGDPCSVPQPGRWAALPRRGACLPLSHVFASRTRASSSPFPLPLARSFSPSLLSFFVSSHLSFSHQAILGVEFLTVNMVGTVVHLMS